MLSGVVLNYFNILIPLKKLTFKVHVIPIWKKKTIKFLQLQETVNPDNCGLSKEGDYFYYTKHPEIGRQWLIYWLNDFARGSSIFCICSFIFCWDFPPCQYNEVAAPQQEDRRTGWYQPILLLMGNFPRSPIQKLPLYLWGQNWVTIKVFYLRAPYKKILLEER